MSDQANFGISITAHNRTKKGADEASRTLGGVQKLADSGADRGAMRTERAYRKSGAGIVRSFGRIEAASGRAFGGSSVAGGGLISRLGALKNITGLVGESMGSAAAEAGLMEAGLVGIGGAATGVVGVVTTLAIASAKLADGWGRNANSLGNMASMLGVSTKGLQEFAGAAERVGVDKNTAMGAIGGLSQSLNDARYGRNTAAMAVLAKAGVGMKLRADGDVDVDAMLPAIASAMKRQSPSGRRTIAHALGISDAAIPAFTQGGDALAGDMADYGRNGAVYSDEDVAAGRRITHRDTAAMQLLGKGKMYAESANGGFVDKVGTAAIDFYRRHTGATGPGLGEPSLPTEVDGSTGMKGRTLFLSREGMRDLKKGFATEWDGRSAAQGRGILDTIANRVASGHWGNTVADVLNARAQFSDVNGRPAWQKGRHSVAEIPASRVSRKADKFVEMWARDRMAGAPSIVGDNLNYANPNYSDRRNLEWIDKLDGPTLGAGRSIHRHGTTPNLEQYRPGPIKIDVEVTDARVKATARRYDGAAPAISYATLGGAR